MPASPRVSAPGGPGGRPRDGLPTPEAQGSTEERSLQTRPTSHPVLTVRSGDPVCPCGTGGQIRSGAAADTVTPPDVPGASSLGQGWAGTWPHTGVHRHGQAGGSQMLPADATASPLPPVCRRGCWGGQGPLHPTLPQEHGTEAPGLSPPALEAAGIPSPGGPNRNPAGSRTPARDPAPPQPETADLRKTK